MAQNWPRWSGRIFQFESLRFRVVSIQVSGFIVGNDFWPDPVRSSWNLAWSNEIWPRFRQIMARSHRIWSEMLNISPKTLKVLVQAWLHRFWNAKPTTDPLGSSLTVQNPHPIAGVVESGGGEWDSGGLAKLSGSAGLLNSPSSFSLIIMMFFWYI